ncbi:hypothetical protein [Aliamphritea hakodatensis]|uniref:hypothetical protein n=1 Tax=Aliamphritea hakodatensis TaxID=2895352 RepID=UPI0022FD6D73|nr:hypothetical protein [Aliamphritea hakodatensis]
MKAKHGNAFLAGLLLMALSAQAHTSANVVGFTGSVKGSVDSYSEGRPDKVAANLLVAAGTLGQIANKVPIASGESIVGGNGYKARDETGFCHEEYLQALIINRA